ncbi:FHA domain-containing protein [Actinoplanes sp. NPDC051346]|uniref:FHA domain-containing protein n=1 Tax=Actinoplanes sp. NPDC051346 TaxID=3155048 RepID=UPI003449A6B9
MVDLVLDIAIPGTPSFRVPLRPGTAPLLVGRANDSDLVIASPYVSRHHAWFSAGNGSWWVEDAGSSAGLLLNGDPVTRRRQLHGGDRLRLGNVDIVMSLSTGPEGNGPGGRSAEYHIQEQRAGTINMVDGAQYNSHYNQVIQQRESFAREIAATRSKATILIVIGFLMVCGGSVTFMIPLLDFMNDFGSVSPQETITGGNFYGPKVGGVSVGLIGFAIGFIGQFVLIAGIVLRVVAAARSRKLNRLPRPEAY